MLFTQDSGFLRVSGWQKIGVLVSIVWMIGLIGADVRFHFSNRFESIMTQMYRTAA
jgi:hypothetical protein